MKRAVLPKDLKIGDTILPMQPTLGWEQEQVTGIDQREDFFFIRTSTGTIVLGEQNFVYRLGESNPYFERSEDERLSPIHPHS